VRGGETQRCTPRCAAQETIVHARPPGGVLDGAAPVTYARRERAPGGAPERVMPTRVLHALSCSAVAEKRCRGYGHWASIHPATAWQKRQDNTAAKGEAVR
jgi:hypothetical protein